MQVTVEQPPGANLATPDNLSARGGLTILVSFALALCVVGTYWPIRDNHFIPFDDVEYITGNYHVNAGFTSDSLRWAFTHIYAANWHPLTWLSHMLDCQFWGLKPTPHHLTNLALHILSTILLFLIFRLATRRIWPSAFVAAVFGLHPVHVESVAWAAERKDVLSGFCFMLTLLCYVWYARRPTLKRYLLVLSTFALGLLAKPMLVTLPFVLMLLDYWPLHRIDNREGDRRPLRALLLEKVPLLALAIGASIVTYLGQTTSGAAPSLEAYTFGLRLQNAIVSYLRYIGKTFWPTKLAVFYPIYGDFKPPLLWVSALAVLVVVTALVIIWRKHRYLLVGWLWFLGMLVPVIGIVQVGMQSMADRYMYLPMIGLTIMVAWGALELCQRFRLRQVVTVLSIAVLVVCSIMTWRQVRYWKDGLTLFYHALEVARDNPLAEMIVGSEYGNRDEVARAVPYFRRAIQLDPTYAGGYTGLGRALMFLKQYGEAHEVLQKADQLDQRDPSIALNMGDLAGEQGDYAEAVRQYLRSLDRKSDQPQVQYNLAIALMHLNDFSAAEDHLRRMLKMTPGSAEAHYHLSKLLLRRGQRAQAETELRESLRLEPKSPQAQFDLAMIELGDHHFDSATKSLRESVRLDPNFFPAVQNLAWLLATAPQVSADDANEALQLAQRADEAMKHKDAGVLDTLAAAQATKGQFDRALQIAQEAATLANRSGDTKLAKEIESRQAGYRQKRRYVDTIWRK